jgi:hypothetical protein
MMMVGFNGSMMDPTPPGLSTIFTPPSFTFILGHRKALVRTKRRGLDLGYFIATFE